VVRVVTSELPRLQSGIVGRLYDRRANPRAVGTARLILLGVKEKFRVQRRYGYLPMALVYEIKTRGEKLGYQWGELGWTLETNTSVNVMIKAMGCEAYKTYRVFEKLL
jgi:hypothetical protein